MVFFVPTPNPKRFFEPSGQLHFRILRPSLNASSHVVEARCIQCCRSCCGVETRHRRFFGLDSIADTIQCALPAEQLVGDTGRGHVLSLQAFSRQTAGDQVHLHQLSTSRDTLQAMVVKRLLASFGETSLGR